MPKYLITWDAGYGECSDVIEASNQDHADEAAYQAWREAVDSQAEHQAMLLTEELAGEYGHDWEVE